MALSLVLAGHGHADRPDRHRLEVVWSRTRSEGEIDVPLDEFFGEEQSTAGPLVPAVGPDLALCQTSIPGCYFGCVSTEGADSLVGLVQGGNGLVSVRGTRLADTDFIAMGELVSPDASGEPVWIRLEVEADVVSALDYRYATDRDNTLVFSENGEETPFQIRDYVQNDVTGSLVMHSGRLINFRDDFSADFGVVTDPIQLPLITGLLLIVGCPLMSGASFLSEWVQARTSGWRDACKAKGYFPFVVPVFSLRVRGWKLDVECQAKARIECRDLSGRVIETHETEFERLAAA